MAEKIRRIEDGDFQAVSALYNGRKSVEELQWLFTNPDDQSIYNAFVAIDKENQVIGVIGYVLSDYNHGGNKRIKGVIPISWKLLPDYKGMAGVMLFKKILALGKFGLTIAGSETAQDLYKLFKFKYVSDIDHYYKILNAPNALKSLHRKSIVKTLGMFGFLLPSYFKKSKTRLLNGNIKLIPYDGVHYMQETAYDDIFKKTISKNYIDWLLHCPILKTYAFNIQYKNKNLGTCVMYISGKGKNSKGRIVHLPYLENDIIIWESVINKCSNFLRQEGCCMVSGLAHNKENQIAYQKAGFIKIKKHSKPLFIKDSQSVLDDIDLNNWFLQFSEGDKAYRSF